MISLKDFFRPTLKKIILFMVLILVGHLLSKILMATGIESFIIGIPFPIYAEQKIHYFSFIVQIVVWYTLSCLFTNAFNKNK